MDTQIMQASLEIGLGAYFLFGLAVLIWAAAAAECGNRHKLREQGKAKQKDRKEGGSWVFVQKENCLARMGKEGDLFLIKSGTLIRGFAMPEVWRPFKRTISQPGRITL